VRGKGKRRWWKEEAKEMGHTTSTFRTPVVLDLIIDKHPDCIVRIGWETCTSNVTFGELSSAMSKARGLNETRIDD